MNGFCIKALMLTVALAVTATAQTLNDVSYIDANGTERTANNVTEIDPWSITTIENLSGWYIVRGTLTKTGAFTVSGTAHIILENGCDLTVNGSSGNAGINVSDGNSLTIYAQSTGSNMGKLTVKGNGGAGIGGARGSDGEAGISGGNITINGGNITATGSGGAGIGGGNGGVGQVGSDGTSRIGIYIYGSMADTDGNGVGDIGGNGDVGGSGGSGGSGGNSGNIIINGGNVTANGGNGSAGIGGGDGANGGDGGSGGNGGGIVDYRTSTFTCYNGGNGGTGGDGGGSGGGNITINGGVVTIIGNIGNGISGNGGNGGNGGLSGTGRNVNINSGCTSYHGSNGSNGSDGNSGNVAFTLDGNGVVFANSVSDDIDSRRNGGIFFIEKFGKAYGNVTIPANLSIPSNYALEIPAGITITIPKDITLSIASSAMVKNNGTIIVCGTLSGTVSDNQPNEECKTISPVIVSRITNSQIIVQATSNAIMLENLPSNAKVQVYNLQGNIIHTVKTHDTRLHTLPVHVKGVYIVKINNNTMRIVVK